MKPVLLQNVTLIDGREYEPQKNMDVLVDEGRISALGISGSLEVKKP